MFCYCVAHPDLLGCAAADPRVESLEKRRVDDINEVFERLVKGPSLLRRRMKRCAEHTPAVRRSREVSLYYIDSALVQDRR